MSYATNGTPLDSFELRDVGISLFLVEIDYQTGLMTASTTQCGSDMFEIGERCIINITDPDIVYKVCLYDEDSKFTGVYGDPSVWLSGENAVTGKYAKLKVKYTDNGSCAGKIDEISQQITVKRYISQKTLKKARFSAIPVADSDAINTKDTKFLTLCSTKTAYTDDKIPVTIGWLYRTNISPYKFYYSSGVPDRLEYLFTWDKTATYNGNADPMLFSIGITTEGDIICVPRGEYLGSRYNPTVYPHDDYDNPVVVDFGNDSKPTGWLQNDGFYGGDEGYVCFGEYTRPALLTTSIWKVVSPYTQKSNWSIKNTFTLSGSNTEGMKHTHNVDKDPFTGLLYSSTGDDENGAKFLYSDDDGDTWTVFLGHGDDSGLTNFEKYCRQLNFIWTKDYIYWATDSSLQSSHCLFRAVRDEDGLLDVAHIETLYTFAEIGAATYHICYIADPEGFLLLNRYDGNNKRPIDVYFWDLKTGKMQNIGTLGNLSATLTNGCMLGFRCDAVSHYPYYSGNTVVCGFSLSPNNMIIYNNTFTAQPGAYGYVENDASNDGCVNNIAITVE